MTDPKRCWLVGGGDFYAAAFYPAPNDTVIAVDAGYEKLKSIGITPDIVVGDFDSLGYTPDHPETEVHSPIKDDTDTMLAVEKGIELGCNEFYIFGATGGRIAHTFGNLQVLSFIAEKGLSSYIFDRDTVITALTDCTLKFDKNSSGYISLLPFGCDKADVTIKGLKYELDKAELPHNRPLGISNEFLGKEAEISVNSGTVIAVWESTAIMPERSTEN